MIEFKKASQTTKACATCAIGLFSRLLVVLFAATMSLASSAAVFAQQSAQSRAQAQKIAVVGTVEDGAIRPFRVNVPQEALDDLRRRIAATRWPDKETVADGSQGVQLARLQELVRYWGSGYDWRKAEAKLNALPQFVTTLDGVDIHFIHVRSRYKNALPVIITHGWPGSVIEQRLSQPDLLPRG